MNPQLWNDLNEIRGRCHRQGLNLFEELDRLHLIASAEHDTQVRVDTVDRLIDLLEHKVTVQVLYARLGEPIEHTPANLMRAVIDWLTQIKNERPK